MNNATKVMTDEILEAGWKYAEEMAEEAIEPELPSPLESVATPLGWKTTMMILAKSKFDFSRAAEKLCSAWAPALVAINEHLRNKDQQVEAVQSLFTAEALRSRVRAVGREHYVQARRDLKSKMPRDKKEAARKILKEAESLAKRYGWEFAGANPKKSEPQAKLKTGTETETAGTAEGDGAQVKPKTRPKLLAGDVGEPAKLPAPVKSSDKPAEPSPEARAGAIAPVPAPPNTTQEIVAAPPVTPSPAEQRVGPEPFKCPICQGAMVERTIRNGKNAGTKFYGCQKFSKTSCKGTRDLAGNETTRV